MTRRWQPKYKVCCTVCGWRGRRTLRTMSYPCPRCYPGRKMTQRESGGRVTVRRDEKEATDA